MKYDFSNKYRINVSGTAKEIQLLIKELSNTLDSGSSYKQLENELNNLEKIVKLEQYTFGIHHRIYYNHNSLLYVPNTSSKEGQKFHYSIFKQLFDKAVTKIEESQLKNTKNDS